ncbi:MAG: hypothetical protein ABH823_05560 [bacterium]
MRKRFKIIGGLTILIVCFCFNSVAAAQQAGLHFTVPKIDVLENQSVVESGAWGDFQVVYGKNAADFDAADNITGAMLYFNPDDNVVDQIIITKLVDKLAMGGADAPNADGVYQIEMYMPDPNDNIPLGNEIALLNVRFHVTQGLADNTDWNVAWQNNDEHVNVSLFNGTARLGKDSTSSDAAWSIEDGRAPGFDGSSGAAENPDPATGNTLSVSWNRDGNDGDGLADRDAATYNGAVGAAGLDYQLLVYRDGAQIAAHDMAVGQTSRPAVSGLDDNQTYEFRVRAADNCQPAPNWTDVPTAGFTGVPHDYSPPGARISIGTADDQTLPISWSATDTNDVAGFMVVRQEIDPAEAGNAVEMPVFAGANRGDGMGAGTAPDEVENTLRALPADGGWQFLYRGTDTSLNDGGLDNSKAYRYWVYAWDRNGTFDGLINQGFNWSMSDPAVGMPGAAPTAVQDFVVLSNVVGGMTVRWKTSTPPNYAGLRIVTTTNIDGWGALNVANSTLVADVDYSGTDAQRANGDVIEQSYVWRGGDTALVDDTVYYFAARAYNSSKLNWSDGVVYGVAVPGKTGGDVLARRGEANINFKKKRDGFGINTVVLPFEVDGLITLADLLNVVNVHAADHGEFADLPTAKQSLQRLPQAVGSIGWWDKDEQIAKGFVFDDNGVIKERIGIDADVRLADIPLQTFVGYQIYMRYSTTEPLRLLERE